MSEVAQVTHCSSLLGGGWGGVRVEEGDPVPGPVLAWRLSSCCGAHYLRREILSFLLRFYLWASNNPKLFSGLFLHLLGGFSG